MSYYTAKVQLTQEFDTPKGTKEEAAKNKQVKVPTYVTKASKK